MAEEKHCPECGGELPSDAPQGLCPQCLMKLGLPTGAEPGPAAPEPGKSGPSDGQEAVPTSTTPPRGFVPPKPAELAGQFPQLEVLELLGQGGMGAVYKARQKQLDRLVALKILPPEVGQTEAFAERFKREARSMARLTHSRIVTVHEFGRTDDGLYYFIMEFVDGTDLRQVIRAGQLGPSEALAIVPQVCEALQYAHEEGIVHRDIKPENILLDRKGRVKIADFGLAKLLDMPPTAYTLTRPQHRMGTPHYMAPEQIEHPSQVDHRADIYSLGVVFYEMLTGQLPIGHFAPPSHKVQVDVRLDSVVLKTLAHEPERRYQHASEVKTDVETIAAGVEPPQSRSAQPPRPKGTPGTSPGQRLPQAEQRAGEIETGVEAISAADMPASSSAVPSERVEAARRRLRIPAIGLMISGAVNFLFLALVLVLNFWAMEWVGTRAEPGMLVVDVMTVATVVGAIIMLGGWQMLKLRSYGWAVACSVLALVPLSAGFMLGVPMGIWALIVLNRSDVQQAFATSSKRRLGRARRRPGMLFGIKIEDHLKIVAYIRIGLGSLFLVAAVVLFSLLAIPGIVSGDHDDIAILMAYGLALALLPLVSAVWDLVGGIGLLKRRRWARILVLIGAAPELFALPVGTATGIYTIWVLMKKETVQLFTRAAARDDAVRRRVWAPAIGLMTGAVVIVVVSAIAVRFILEHKARPSSEEIRLVVLPFENLGSDEDEYFATGITDAITARLAGLHGLGVISRQSAMQYKKTEKNARQIAKELGGSRMQAVG
jgi:serine/threonine protein kinase